DRKRGVVGKRGELGGGPISKKKIGRAFHIESLSTSFVLYLFSFHLIIFYFNFSFFFFIHRNPSTTSSQRFRIIFAS
ncbi:hypothetical protein, partial [Clostridium sp. ZBS13]|uniref:hypothetical protein n=1 Tax=Clostridium sp. ZBS13 TaxID=2949971 RepID=UPI00207991E7